MGRAGHTGMRKGLEGRADRCETLEACDDEAVGGSSIGLIAVRSWTFVKCFDRSSVSCKGLVQD